jgi:hypothetical protein
MAKIVLGLGTPHTPLFTLQSIEWTHRADADYANPHLNLSDGRWLTYEQLLGERGPTYEAAARPEELERKSALCEQLLDRSADELAAAAPDVVVIVGDDHRELFGLAMQPAFAIYHADELVTSDAYSDDDSPGWIRSMGRGYMMDARHTINGASAFALELIEGLIDEGVDVTAIAKHDGRRRSGLGHAFGFIVNRLFRGRPTPIVPILLNTYYPPNVLGSGRCYDIGAVLRKVIDASPRDLRVAIIASGGLSHFVVDEELDLRVINACIHRDAETLRSVPRCALNSGSSEILNWILAAGALQDLKVNWTEYVPLYRTAAGTGVGAGFVAWRN